MRTAELRGAGSSRVVSVRARTVALTDIVLAALKIEHGTADEIAQRIGTVACNCWESGTAGRAVDGTLCFCVRRGGGVPGFRPAARHDVQRILDRLRAARVVEHYPDPRGSKCRTWALIRVRAVDDLEAWFEQPAFGEMAP